MATTLTQTTLSGAVSLSAGVLNVTSATNLFAPSNQLVQQIYVINPETARGELMTVAGISGTAIQVSRLSGFRQAFNSGALVICGLNSQYLPSFQAYDPVGAVTAANVAVTPWINVTNGNQWIRSVDGLWIPGWQNVTAPQGVAAAVASAAGQIVPSGPLFHITGALAITGFVNSSMIGFTGGSFTVIPDGNFTWTAANNIAVLGTAVTNRALTFTWDSNAARWNPSYV